jgi:hypothetical protein
MAAGSPHGDLTGQPVAASEKGRPGSHDRPLRREARPHGGAQPSRGHRRETLGWISNLNGISVPHRNVSRSFGPEMRSRIKPGFGPGREETVPDRTGLRPRERWDSSGSNRASAQGEMGQFRIEPGFGPGRDGTPRDKVGDCREPDWSGTATSEQTPRGQDHGRASSGFCASSLQGGQASHRARRGREPASPVCSPAADRIARSLLPGTWLEPP